MRGQNFLVQQVWEQKQQCTCDSITRCQIKKYVCNCHLKLKNADNQKQKKLQMIRIQHYFHIQSQYVIIYLQIPTKNINCNNTICIIMCITFFYLNPLQSSSIKFILAFNRDENADRETQQFGQFQDDPNIYAGKDILSGGSWLGINVKTGIMVILTNYRLLKQRNGKSRGLLVRRFLQTKYCQNLLPIKSPSQLSQKIFKDMTEILKNPLQYSPHNISVYNIKDTKIFYMCSQIGMKQPIILKPGITHGYSNTDINTSWPKVERGKNLFNKMIERIFASETQKQGSTDKIFNEIEQIMRDRQGFGCLKQRQASIFIPLFYSWIKLADRMTKSTFYAIIHQKKGQFFIEVKEVTYLRNNQEKIIQLQLQL